MIGNPVFISSETSSHEKIMELVELRRGASPHRVTVSGLLL